ncbi:MAG: hypothetical protein WCH86_02315 [Kiritimatiellales bacterium]
MSKNGARVYKVPVFMVFFTLLDLIFHLFISQHEKPKRKIIPATAGRVL